MRSSRIVLNLVVVAAAVFLSGCYVASKNLPAGQEIVDQQLIGAWEAIDENGRPSTDATFLHFLRNEEGQPLLMVLVDDHSATTYEMHTINIANKHMFAVKPLNTTNRGEKPEPNYILGYYEVKGDDVFFNLLDIKKLKPLLEAGKLKGVAEKGDYGKITLTGSPQELASFLAGADPATLVGGERPAHAHRVSPRK